MTDSVAAFNSWYAEQKLVGAGNPFSPFFVALTAATLQVLKKGLWILGIRVPDAM